MIPCIDSLINKIPIKKLSIMEFQLYNINNHKNIDISKIYFIYSNKTIYTKYERTSYMKSISSWKDKKIYRKKIQKNIKKLTISSWDISIDIIKKRNFYNYTILNISLPILRFTNTSFININTNINDYEMNITNEDKLDLKSQMNLIKNIKNIFK